MSTIKHTPGPWTIEPDSMFGYKVLGTKQDGAWPIMFQGDLPNARLIAAAPELLEACRLAESIIGDEMEGCVSEGCSVDKPCSYCQDGRAAIKQIAAAIAKAEGKL